MDVTDQGGGDDMATLSICLSELTHEHHWKQKKFEDEMKNIYEDRMPPKYNIHKPTQKSKPFG